MDRRTFLALVSASAGALSVAASSQDYEYIKALERAQLLRPATLTSHARIAPGGEPGTPLIISGRVVQRDGRSPAPGIVVFAYHTDAQGLYDVRSNGPHSWRLKGWALTDAEGRFEFTTIRPAPYPSRKQPAHVHLSIEGPRLGRHSAGILFDDDPLVSPDERAKSAKAGEFGEVRPVVVRNGVQYVDFLIRITEQGKF